MHDPRRIELENRYRVLRHAARLAVMAELAGTDRSSIRLAEIGAEALAACQRWKNRRVNWDWQQLVRTLRGRHRRIELAIWNDPMLCGLAIGKISDGRVIARIDYWERAPGNHPLVGLIGEIATLYLQTVGVLVGCHEAVLSSPLMALLDFYRELGQSSQVKEFPRKYAENAINSLTFQL
ncbi:hypothetical protein PO883_22020 [Massilia sp. DJPM01]|uniref:hypothetical protein n=1 Tax=Massilia sp. DJPM01 TaxID=3024404 RepID=UPI00259FB790|nr:hypothetical protein [Massilia sp. DJPM01]MDM5179872.1 hypothetical protein [Massilia sp. DJPM01]